jgi:hypothetical protein
MTSDEELDMEKIKEVVGNSQLPDDLKKELLTNLPMLLTNIGEAAATVYDPNKIWLEAIQFADYVQQHVEHLSEKHGPECEEESLETLQDMTASFKLMAENAMRVLDTLEVKSELVNWSEVKITYGEDKDAQ